MSHFFFSFSPHVSSLHAEAKLTLTYEAAPLLTAEALNYTSPLYKLCCVDIRNVPDAVDLPSLYVDNIKNVHFLS